MVFDQTSIKALKHKRS